MPQCIIIRKYVVKEKLLLSFLFHVICITYMHELYKLKMDTNIYALKA